MEAVQLEVHLATDAEVESEVDEGEDDHDPHQHPARRVGAGDKRHRGGHHKCTPDPLGELVRGGVFLDDPGLDDAAGPQDLQVELLEERHPGRGDAAQHDQPDERRQQPCVSDLEHEAEREGHHVDPDDERLPYFENAAIKCLNRDWKPPVSRDLPG